MAKREALVELVRKKDDLENMLASLETAYREASISEEHYKEMKEKNQKKLDEIKEKIKKKGGAEEMPEVPLSTPEPEEEVPVSTPGPEVPEKAEKEIKLEGAPENLNEALSKIVNELKSDKGLAERFEKFQVELEKLKTMMDAKKDEKSLMEERLQRVIEEVGEIRSSTSSMEGRLSEQEMKMEELKEIIDFLKPERFTKDLQKKDAELKSHEDKIERLDETMSMILKNINAIKNVLERMGSIENIARMSNEISKKLIEIDEKSKKMTRVADRIDNIFVELNKRMEEFLFYKAKQDALDALSKETLKSIDEINMKLENFAQRSELEDLRAVMGGGQSEVSAPVEEETSEPDEITKLKFQKQEIKDFLNMLDEQHKGGEINEKDYQQAKKTNTEKIKK